MIKEKIERLIEVLYGRELSVHESLFRVIILVGETAAVISIIENLAVLGFGVFLIALIAVAAIMAVAGYITFKYGHTDSASIIVGVALVLILFPSMFFFSGGTDGGADIWFALGIFYSFMMFSGRRLYLFLIIDIVTYMVVYHIAFVRPELVVHFSNNYERYIDSCFGAITVGVVCGIIMRLQIQLYRKEREIVEKQNQELEHATKAQNAFFAGTSHEIRTPINAIIGMNEMIMRKSDDPELLNYSEKINTSSRILLDYINDILDYTQLEQKQMIIMEDEYSPSVMIQELVDIIQPRAVSKKLEFQIEVESAMPRILLGDAKRIQQVLINLLTNAVKYTNEGKVTFLVSVERISNSMVNIVYSVNDTGIGIRKEDVDKLYDAYQRMDVTKNAKIEGSGLGLAITRQLVELMDGQISVDSIYTKGSTFTVSLKQKIVDETPIGNINFLAQKQAGKRENYRQLFEAPEARILLVDDNAMNGEVVKNLLSETKLKIDVASSGQECLEKTKQKYYHVILMDYLMPDMNGIETLRILKKQENSLCRETPVILMTAGTVGEIKNIIQENEFDGYLEKPIKYRALEEELLRQLPDEVVEYRREILVGDEGSQTTEPVVRKRKKRLYVTTDCVADIPEELINKYGIKVMHLYIRTAKGRFADTIEIDSDNIGQYITKNDTTAWADSVSVEEYETFFAQMLSEAENVIHISMASNSGKSYHVAKAAAKGFDHVKVIDSEQISCGQGLVALAAVKFAKEGLPINEIIQQIEVVKKQIDICFVAPNIDIFGSNGYADPYSTKICHLLHAHPVLGMRKGKISFVGMQFGDMEKTWQRFIRRQLWNKRRIDTDIIYITYVNLSKQELELIKREVYKYIQFDRVIMQKASFSCACNVGDHTFGLAVYKKE